MILLLYTIWNMFTFIYAYFPIKMENLFSSSIICISTWNNFCKTLIPNIFRMLKCIRGLCFMVLYHLRKTSFVFFSCCNYLFSISKTQTSHIKVLWLIPCPWHCHIDWQFNNIMFPSSNPLKHILEFFLHLLIWGSTVSLIPQHACWVHKRTYRNIILAI